jgi:hypothetical protein
VECFPPILKLIVFDDNLENVAFHDVILRFMIAPPRQPREW